MTPLGIVLEGRGVGPLVAGGKGAALDRLVALRARVPRTGVLTTGAYQAFEATAELRGFVDHLRHAPVPPPDQHHHARAQVDEAFLATPMPTHVADAIESLAQQVGLGGLLAVRSSATAEDLASASFAGQYESYLNVAPDGVLDAVRLVWASLWYPAPRAYRRFRSIDETDLTMAVVVMEMLDPSHAGVLFTVDPGGNPGAARLEVVEGLGEQLVSGEKTPDAYVVPRDRLHDELGRIAAPLAQLASEALRLEVELGGPQDIEFAIQDQQLFLVQARPITTVTDASRSDDGFDFSCGDDTTYTTAGIAEMLPGVLPPLSWSINSWLLENGFRNLFDLLGGGAEALTHRHALIGRFHGRAALNLHAMSDAAASIPGGSAEELQHQYFGEAITTVHSAPTAPAKTAGAAQGLRVLRARRRAVEDSEVAIQAVHAVVEDEPALARMSDEELLAYWNRLLHLAQRVVADEVAVAAMASAAYRSVEVFLQKHLSPAEASTATQALTSSDSRDHRSRIALALDELTQRIRDEPELADHVSEDWAETRAAFERSVLGHRVVNDFFTALRHAGSTGIFAGHTWDEVPHLAWLTIYLELTAPEAPHAEADRAHARVELEQLLVRTPRWRWTRFVTGQVMDVRRRFLRREATDAAEFLHRREQTKAAVLMLGGVVRRANQEIGLRLAHRGLLESTDDVEMLSVGEIPMVVGRRGPTLETIALRRRRNLEAQQMPPLPQVFVGAPPEPTHAEVTGERFEGWSASPGRYEGVARVVDSPATSTLRRGEVLVATTTDASWAPLFMAAGAVIVEQGGPLSHAAIVARELGMPAVANVPGIIARLRQEATPPQVMVDGTEGVVVIHRDDDHVVVIDPVTTEPAPSSQASGDDVLAGVAPVRQHASRWDDTNGSLHVFVAGLMGAGALMSVLVGLTESISSTRGRERLRRQAAPVAAMMAEGAIRGHDAVLVRPTGLRPRRHYALASLVLIATAVVLLATSLHTYLSEASGSVVGFALSATGAATLTGLGAMAAVAAHRWPAVPPAVRRLAPGRPRREHSVWATVSPQAKRIVVAMLTVVAIGGVIAVVAEDWLLRIDEHLYFDWLEAHEGADRIGPNWLNRLGQPIVIIPLAFAIGASVARCRVVAIAWPAAIVGGGVVNVVLGWLVHRERPPFSAHAGEFTSYPGGHSIQLTLLMGMLPLCAQVLTRSNRVMRVVAVLAAAVWVIAWTDTVRTGGHWPADQLAGLLIALSFLTVVYSVARRDLQHEACEDCPDHAHAHRR